MGTAAAEYDMPTTQPPRLTNMLHDDDKRYSHIHCNNNKSRSSSRTPIPVDRVQRCSSCVQVFHALRPPSWIFDFRFCYAIFHLTSIVGVLQNIDIVCSIVYLSYTRTEIRSSNVKNTNKLINFTSGFASAILK